MEFVLSEMIDQVLTARASLRPLLIRGAEQNNSMVSRFSRQAVRAYWRFRRFVALSAISRRNLW